MKHSAFHPASEVTLRPMSADDLPHIMDIQISCYGASLLEPEEVLRQRQQVSDGTSWVAMQNGHIHAYLSAYRSLLGQVTVLHGQFKPIKHPDTLYLHDLAVHPQAAGQGLGLMLVQTALAAARQQQLIYSALVSVQNSHLFWERSGYTDHALTDPTQLSRLATYGALARYMVCALDKAAH